MLRFELIEQSRRPTLDHLWQLYKHDLSEFRDSHPNDEGLFVTKRSIDQTLADGDHEAALIYLGNELAGFVIVGRLTGEVRDVSEFFIVRSRRNQGLGAVAAQAVLKEHPGSWEIAFQEKNTAAATFWRHVADLVTDGNFERNCVRYQESPTFIPISGSCYRPRRCTFAHVSYVEPRYVSRMTSPQIQLELQMPQAIWSGLIASRTEPR